MKRGDVYETKLGLFLQCASNYRQPMTGITAEKHDSFIQPAVGGTVIMNFSGKQLIKGERARALSAH